MVRLALPVGGSPGPGRSEHPSNDGVTDFGPLAVVDLGGGVGSLAGGGTGTVEITDDCVVVVRDDGQRVLPIWQDDSVAWDPEAQVIRLHDGQQVIEIRDEDRVSLGGEALEDDVPTTRGDIPWVQKPSPGCAGGPFLVGQLQVR